MAERLVQFLLLGLVLTAKADNHFDISFADGVRKVGPLLSASETQQVQSRLDNNRIRYRTETTETTESLGYIVVTEPFISRAAADPTLRDLADEGIKDYLYVGRGVYVDRISAGVYRARTAAQRRADSLNQAGFDFYVIERTQTVSAYDIIITDNLYSDADIRRILAGDSIEMEEPVVEPPSKPVEQIVAEPEPVVSEPEPIAAEPEPVVSEPPAALTTDVEETKPQRPPPAKVVRSPEPAMDDSAWLWILFVGISIIVIGSLAYYYLQRRQEQEATALSEDKQQIPFVEQVATPEEPEESPEVSRGMIFDYAEAVLAGRAGSSVSQSLTILGSDDTTITDLIQDLIFLTKLSEGQVELSPLSFDSRSLVDNLINQHAALAGKKQITLKSSLSDDLPSSILLDASKLERVLGTLIHYAIERTESGQISINQSFENSQLETEVRFHATERDMEAQLATVMDPANTTSSLKTEERVRFGVAGRLTTALGGTLQANIEFGEAVIRIAVPGAEIQKPQLILPSGKTIDDLLEAEAKASEEIAKAREEAEARIAESDARSAEIEKNAEESIVSLKEQLTAIEQSSNEQSKNLEESESAIASLKAELETIRSESENQLQEEAVLKSQAESELSSLNAELERTQEELQQALNARAETEKVAQQRVSDLERELKETREAQASDTEGLRANENQAKAEVSELQERLTELKSLAESSVQEKAAAEENIAALKAELAEAQEKLNAETQLRADAEQGSEDQIKSLVEQLNEARANAEQESAEKALVSERLQSLNDELGKTRQELESVTSEAEALRSSSQAEVDKLQADLEQAKASLEQEQQSRQEAEGAVSKKVTELETTLETLRSDSAKELAEREERIQSASTEIERLTSELNAAEEKVVEITAQSEELDESASEEVEILRTELKEAQAKLEEESEKRNRVDSAAGSQINELVDELNQTKARVQESASETARIEEEKLNEINNIQSDLKAAEEALESERSAKAALAEENEQLKSQAERAEAFGQHQTELLQQALSDADNAVKVEAAARKVAKHLKARVAELKTRLDVFESRPATPEAEEKPDEKPASTALVAEPTEEVEPEVETETTEPVLEAEQETPAEEEPDEPVLDIQEEEEAKPPQEKDEPADDYAVSSDVDFSLDDFGEDEGFSAPEDEIVEEEIDEEEVVAEEVIEEEIDEEEVVAEEVIEEEIVEEEIVEEEATTEEEVEERISTKQPAGEQEDEKITFDDTVIEEATLALEDFGDLSVGDDAETEAALEPEAEEAEEPEEAVEEQPEPEEEVEEDADVELVFDDKPIRSSRPVNNPVLHSMIVRFQDRLFEHIENMERSLAVRDYLELVVSCNWVRGEANTLGFETLIGPIDSIEQHLRKNKFSQIITHISILRNMAERIETKHHEVDEDSKVQYIVPNHAKNAVIYENFVSQLGSKLLELEVAAHAGNGRQMTQLCRWIDRYGTKIKFVEVVDAATQLQEAIDAENSDAIDQQLREFIDLYGKIEIVRTTA